MATVSEELADLDRTIDHLDIRLTQVESDVRQLDRKLDRLDGKFDLLGSQIKNLTDSEVRRAGLIRWAIALLVGVIMTVGGAWYQLSSEVDRLEGHYRGYQESDQRARDAYTSGVIDPLIRRVERLEEERSR